MLYIAGLFRFEIVKNYQQTLQKTISQLWHECHLKMVTATMLLC